MYCIECGKELGVYEFDKCIFCRESDNMNAWKVVMLMETLKEEIKKLIEEKACTSSITEKQRLDREIDSLEANILEMQKVLEKVRVE
jgi:hypothetical protein